MTTVAIIDEEPAFCLGVGRICEEARDLEVVGFYSNVQRFLETASRDIQIVLVQLDISSSNGHTESDAIRQLQTRGHEVLVMSSLTSRHAVTQAITAGASGYLSKKAGSQEIKIAISTVAAGDKYVAPSLAAHLLTLGGTPVEPILTRRECDVLRELAAGRSDRDIAAVLFVSIHTVRTHLDRIATKLNTRNRVRLAVWAVTHGLTNYQ